MVRPLAVVIACAGIAGSLFALSRSVLDDEGTGAAATFQRLPRAPVSALAPTLAREAYQSPDGTEAAEADVSQLGFRRPGDYAAGSPERTVAQFMAAWRDRHWSRMSTWMSSAWLDSVARPATELARRFGGRRPHGYIVLSRLRKPGRVYYRVLVEHRTLRPRLLRETIALRLDHQQPPRRGTARGLRWGVDPVTVQVVARHP